MPLAAMLAALGALVVLVRWALVRNPVRSARVERVSTLVLIALASVAVGNYYGFSSRAFTDSKSFDGYDLMHYYLNAKYFDELGYVGLYDAVVVADHQSRRRYERWKFKDVRDLETSVRKPLSSVYARADDIEAQFSERRWRQFKRDFVFLQRTISRRLQKAMLIDHGYNGPPFLQAIAGPITNRVPVRYVKVLCHVETLWMLLMFVVVWRTFGTRRTALAVLWFAVSFSSRWPGVGAGLFRLDWLVALVIACCLLVDVEPADGSPPSRRQKARVVGAGVLFGFATMMRIFPAVWLFGLGVRALWKFATRRQVDRTFATLLLAFALSSAVFGAIAVRSVGMVNVNEFVEDIREHLQPMNLSQQRMGFGVALGWRGEWSERITKRSVLHEKWALVGSLTPVRYTLAFAALFLLALTIRPRTSAFDATALGFLPFYFLMIASHYYWVHRLTVLLHHSSHDEEGRLDHAVALAMLFGIEAFANAHESATRFRYAVTAIASVLLGVYCVWVIGTRLWHGRAAPQPGPVGDLVPQGAGGP
jgi:hypothetical protein